MGTYPDGTPSDCAVANPCTRIDWPAANVTTDGAGYNRVEPSTWFGSLASTGTEGSGLQYMRNRYYDPKRGQFTQADPIGLAGGLNLYGFAEGDAVNFADRFGTCKVDVRYKELGPGYYHAYILTTAPDNTRTEFRGGPNKGGPASGASSSGSGGATGQTAGSNTNSANSSSPGSGRGGPENTGPFGSIQGTTEPYDKHAIDWQAGSPPSNRVVDNDKPCDSYNKSFHSTLDLITAKNVPYNPFTTNSNSTVRTMLERAGIKGVKPVVWVPGWNTTLF